MSRKKESTKLTSREVDVLNVLWDAGKPMIASDIVNRDKVLSINTVQTVLRELLKKGYVEVADIVYSGTVLCRSYKPTDLAIELTKQNFASQYKKITKSISPSMLFAALLDDEENEDELIQALESIIKEKNSLKGE